MAKLIILATTAALATLSSSSTAAEDSCVLVDLTAEDKIPLRGLNYCALGQDLTISIAIDSINITGLTNFVPQYINLVSPNYVAIGTASSGQVTVEAELSATVEEMDVSATAHLQFVLEQPMISGEYVRMCTGGISLTVLKLDDCGTSD
ncbi:hypothetical protein PC118_g16626 [Phytophthora cactorum]|uniref:Uncharacterized protein n=1 Tax=Phytophthora cactorum TaxID=29920 RepID=A0A8T1F9G5_9STRA|nr:hypothetical protein PC118_g16626 [Phytophthora cactorum]